MPIENLAVQIVRFVDKHNPGIVECEFTDAEGRRHAFVDKAPIFTSEFLWVDSSYPKPGEMQCEVLARWRDANGRELARISTANPLGDETAEGLSEFVVRSEQLSG
jgi:hypothetical protein